MDILKNSLNNDIREFKSFSEFNKYKRNNRIKIVPKSTTYDYNKKLYEDNYYDEPEEYKEYRTYDEDGNEVVYYQTKERKLYAAAPAPDIFTSSSDDAKERTLDRLFSMTGLTYKFNRGIIMIDGSGKKVEDIFDGTSKHHAMRIHEVARDEFGIDVPFISMTDDIAESQDAASKGLALFLLEGNMCQLYLPTDVTNEMVEEIIKEVEPRGDFIFYVVRGDQISDELIQSEVLDYLNSLLVIEEEHDETLSEREIYIRTLLEYTNNNGISIYDYYREVAINYRLNNFSVIPDFERKNPFLTDNDLDMLVKDPDDRMPDFFANSMNRVIELNLQEGIGNTISSTSTSSNTTDNTSSTDTNTNPTNNTTNNNPTNNPTNSTPSNNTNTNPVNPTDNGLKDMFKEDDKPINLDLLDNMNGFAVIREDFANKVNIYGYDNTDKETLRGRKTVDASKYSIKSGYYVNYKDFITNLVNQYIDGEMTFIDENNQELELRTVIQEALTFARKAGTITFGKEEDKNLSYNSISLSGGIYVNRDYLVGYFKKLKVRVKSDINNNTSNIVR